MDYILFLVYPLALIGPRWIIPALALHGGLIAASAYRSGRIPLIGMHETLGFLAFSLGAVLLAFAWNRKRDLLTFLTVPVILLFTAGSLAFPASGGPLTPVLKTFWFELHVILSFVAYAFFGIGAALGALALTPEGAADEPRQYQALLAGYVLFSAAMIFGGIWAFYAWGTYWLWTPKELWTTIVWFWYSLYLHGRLVRGWSGPTAIWMGIAGFFVVLFTYAGVGLLMKSSHEF